MEQCLFYILVLKEILSHVEYLSLCACAFISVPYHPLSLLLHAISLLLI